MIGFYVKKPIFLSEKDKVECKKFHHDEIEKYIGATGGVFFYHIDNKSEDA